jgi:hypothetical protein
MTIFDDIDTNVEVTHDSRLRQRPACLERENVIQREILAQLSQMDGVFAFRQNVVAAKIGKRFIRSGLPGQADITACVRRRGGLGQRVEIECKCRHGGVQSPAQIVFQYHIEVCGGIYLIARDCLDIITRISLLIDK